MNRRIRITKADLAAGEAGNCFRCPVAVALQRATKDDHANVYERDWMTYIQVGALHLLAPYQVSNFVHAVDHAKRDEGGHPIIESLMPHERPKPFAFTLPPWKSPEWKESCYGCEELFQPEELDDEGNCEECRSCPQQ